MSAPSLSQCYRILELTPGADLDAVKSAYRRLAFRHHPDLHPGDTAASERFARINEAYVTIKRHLERQSTAGHRTYSAQDIRQEEEAKAQARRSPGPDLFDRHEDILRDILNDPFAKQVFDEILRKLRTGAPVVEEAQVTMHTPPRAASLPWKERLQSWLLQQLDVEHSMELPASQLLPGSRLRLSLRLPLSLRPRTIEITLPSDFRVGKPIRLRGLGRRLGPWQGDLYLRLYASFS